jgi:phthalate 4,5-cis-dihydrodiol dehydrogenase
VAQHVLRLGFAGLGQAVNHILRNTPELSSLPYAITAAADSRSHALGRFEQEFGASVFPTVEAMCESSNVDVIYVATPPELHREHAIMALTREKHVIVEKPMALTMEDSEAMNSAAEAHGKKLLGGHTHSFDAPVREIAKIVRSGRLGRLMMINSWVFNEFNVRPWPIAELHTTAGPVLNQGPHQVDIVREIGGGMAKSLRAATIWDDAQECEGGYVCWLQFESGVPAMLTFDSRGFFDTAEFGDWVGEDGGPRDPAVSFKMHARREQLDRLGSDEILRALEDQKEAGRYGANAEGKEAPEIWGYSRPGARVRQPMFGITIASCERGAVRHSPEGVIVYDTHGLHETSLRQTLRGRAAELMAMYDAVVHGRPLPHDGRWAEATLEICLAILESARLGREIALSHQVHSTTVD